MACSHGHIGIVKLYLANFTWDVYRTVSKGYVRYDTITPDVPLLEARNRMGYTPFHYACLQGNPEMMRLLLEHQTYFPNAPNHLTAVTPFYTAYLQDPRAGSLVKLILTEFKHYLGRGICWDVLFSKSRSVFYDALENNHDNVVRAILEAYPEHENEGKTASHIVLKKCFTRVVGALLRNWPHGHKIDINKPSKDGVTPFYDAYKAGHYATMKFVLTRFRDSARNWNAPCMGFAWYTPFYQACKDQNVEIASALLDAYSDSYYIDLMAPEQHGRHPFWTAVGNNAAQIVNLMLGKFVDHWRPFEFNPMDEHGSTLFLRFCQEGRVQFVQLWINHVKIDGNQKSTTGQTALMIACQNGYAKMVKLLLENSQTFDPPLDPNFQDGDRRTAAILACLRGHHEVVDVLLQCSEIKWDISDRSGHTAYSTALEMSEMLQLSSLYGKIINSLRDAGKNSMKREPHVGIDGIYVPETVCQTCGNAEPNALYKCCGKVHSCAACVKQWEAHKGHWSCPLCKDCDTSKHFTKFTTALTPGSEVRIVPAKSARNQNDAGEVLDAFSAYHGQRGIVLGRLTEKNSAHIRYLLKQIDVFEFSSLVQKTPGAIHRALSELRSHAKALDFQGWDQTVNTIIMEYEKSKQQGSDLPAETQMFNQKIMDLYHDDWTFAQGEKSVAEFQDVDLNKLIANDCNEVYALDGERKGFDSFAGMKKRGWSIFKALSTERLLVFVREQEGVENFQECEYTAWTIKPSSAEFCDIELDGMEALQTEDQDEVDAFDELDRRLQESSEAEVSLYAFLRPGVLPNGNDMIKYRLSYAIEEDDENGMEEDIIFGIEECDDEDFDGMIKIYPEGNVIMLDNEFEYAEDGSVVETDNKVAYELELAHFLFEKKYEPEYRVLITSGKKMGHVVNIHPYMLDQYTGTQGSSYGSSTAAEDSLMSSSSTGANQQVGATDSVSPANLPQDDSTAPVSGSGILLIDANNHSVLSSLTRFDGDIIVRCSKLQKLSLKSLTDVSGNLIILSDSIKDIDLDYLASIGGAFVLHGNRLRSITTRRPSGKQDQPRTISVPLLMGWIYHVPDFLHENLGFSVSIVSLAYEQSGHGQRCVFWQQPSGFVENKIVTSALLPRPIHEHMALFRRFVFDKNNLQLNAAVLLLEAHRDEPRAIERMLADVQYEKRDAFFDASIINHGKNDLLSGDPEYYRSRYVSRHGFPIGSSITYDGRFTGYIKSFDLKSYEYEIESTSSTETVRRKPEQVFNIGVPTKLDPKQAFVCNSDSEYFGQYLNVVGWDGNRFKVNDSEASDATFAPEELVFKGSNVMVKTGSGFKMGKVTSMTDDEIKVETDGEEIESITFTSTTLNAKSIQKAAPYKHPMLDDPVGANDQLTLINRQDKYGKCLLHYAVIAGLEEVTEVLLEKGASFDIADFKGKTPLQYAAMASPNILNVLLRYGDDPSRRGAITAWEYAGFYQPKEVFEMLYWQVCELDNRKDRFSKWTEMLDDQWDALQKQMIDHVALEEINQQHRQNVVDHMKTLDLPQTNATDVSFEASQTASTEAVVKKLVMEVSSPGGAPRIGSQQRSAAHTAKTLDVDLADSERQRAEIGS